jgi:homoserine dehydrogenase
VARVLGIVNGTTNFILSAMAGGQDYASALARAQELGYAEADPTEDVNGADAAAKIAILASIAFHTRVTLEDVPFEGIERLEAIDASVARELGYRIKLIASAERLDGGVAARVHPTLVPDNHPLATVEGSFNAVMLRGSAIREITLAGPGAGGDETASAVIGDVMTVLGTSGTGFFTHDGYFRKVPVVPEADVPSAFYLRLDVLDAPGVLAQISRVLADQQVSIESVIQRAEGGRAQLVVTTHPAPEGRFFSAVHGIVSLGVVAGDPHVLRVLPR